MTDPDLHPAPTTTPPVRRQPYLHDLVGLIAAPTQCWSAPDGDLAPEQIGVVHADVRVIRRAVLTVDGLVPQPVRMTTDGGQARFVSIARVLQDEQVDGPDPTVRVDRVRVVEPGRLTETITLTSYADHPISAAVALELEPDAVAMDQVKSGAAAPGRPKLDRDGSAVRWHGHGVEARLESPAGTLDSQVDTIRIRSTLTVAARGSAELTIELGMVDTDGPVVAGVTRLDVPAVVSGGAPSAGGRWAELMAGDPRLAPWLSRSLLDLDGLRLARREVPTEEFLGAGAPWYLTLFGRDSLWAARLLLPVDTAIAGGTLRALARLQGGRLDPATEEAPGKIIHELRRADVTFLPPVYYGTIDATCLWISLLHDAWRAGLPEADVRGLLPHLRAALGWVTDSGDADGDGFLEYQDSTGRGLANQGWKDSSDSIRFHDGSIAEGPVALCEAQAYAYEALVDGAALLAELGAGDPDPWLEQAAALADRFRRRFWVERTGLPALALDGRKRQVDAVTSNLGHLLGTGLLEPEEERVIADRLVGDDLRSGLGLRTMSAADGGYNPLSYHCGSVWPHDTAIAIRGLTRAGLPGHAARLADELADASVVFDRRLPELWSGEGPIGVPYPSACRPQAWSAAAVVPALDALAAATT